MVTDPEDRMDFWTAVFPVRRPNDSLTYGYARHEENNSMGIMRARPNTKRTWRQTGVIEMGALPP